MKWTLDLSETVTLLVDPEYDQIVVVIKGDDGIMAESLSVHDFARRVLQKNESLKMVMRANGNGKAEPARTKEISQPGPIQDAREANDFVRAATLIEELRNAGDDGCTVTDLAAKFQSRYANIQQTLILMMKDGKVKRVRPGRYAACIESDEKQQ